MMMSRLLALLLCAQSAHGFDPLCADLKRVVNSSRVFCDVQLYAETTFTDQFAEETTGFAFGNAACDMRTHELRLVVRPRGTQDVAAVMKRLHSRWPEVPVSMRSGGHSYTCNSIKPNSVHFDLRPLDKIELVANTIDQTVAPGEEKLLTTGAGNSFKNLLRKVDARSYSFMHGECYGVGVGGFLLHGGYHAAGLGDRYGNGNTTIRALEMVTADGSVVRFEEPRRRTYELEGIVSYERDAVRVWKDGAPGKSADFADLWMALREAGSSFGIVTEFTMQVYEEPEPTMFFMGVDLTFEQGIQLLVDAGHDDRIVVNYYEPGVPLVDVVFQVAWVDGFLTPAQQREEAFQWLTAYFVRTYGQSWANWRQTKHAELLLNFQDLLKWLGLWGTGEPGHDLAMDLGLYYREDWVTSSMTVDLDDPNAYEVLRWHKRHYETHERAWFGLVPQCWLLFNVVDNRLSTTEGSRLLYVDHSCWPAEDHLEYIQKLEHEFKYDFPDTTYVKYYNVPTWMKNEEDEQQVLGRYFYNYKELQVVKEKYDPRGVFNMYQGVRTAAPTPAPPPTDRLLRLVRAHMPW